MPRWLWLKTALMLATINGDGDAVGMLLSNGATGCKQDQHGFTALTYAVIKCQEPIVQRLLEQTWRLSLSICQITPVALP